MLSSSSTAQQVSSSDCTGSVARLLLTAVSVCAPTVRSPRLKLLQLSCKRSCGRMAQKLKVKAAERGNLLRVRQRRSNSLCRHRAVLVSRSRTNVTLTLRERGSRSGCSNALVRGCTSHAQCRALTEGHDRRAPRKQTAVSTSMSMSTLTHVSGCVVANQCQRLYSSSVTLYSFSCS